jgi:hypothetical protein
VNSLKCIFFDQHNYDYHYEAYFTCLFDLIIIM